MRTFPTPLLLVGLLIGGSFLVFHNTVVVGFILMATGILGLLMFMATVAGHQRPGDNETVIEERHYIGPGDDHRHYRH
ncbi:hypothetical protein [Streptomyces sp. NPDC006668]|jgi:hypothetical protein|uniref:hypothetical protein n=1 Tax=Streptomyces sp. NPDC006668 TaxID=3156903 RepID=UPI001055A5F5